jgi:hypothetical protein
MRLMRRMLSSAQCLAGGPFEFFSERAKRPRELMDRGLEPPIVGCLEIDSELFHQLGALTNAVASEHRLTRLHRLMGGMSACSAWPSSCAGSELKTLRCVHEPRLLADEKCCVGDLLAGYGVRGRAKDGTSRASRDSADQQRERSVPNVWRSLPAPSFLRWFAPRKPRVRARGAACRRVRGSGMLRSTRHR